MAQPIDHVMLRVSDLDESEQWYAEHLGYNVHDRINYDGGTSLFMGPADDHPDGARLELWSDGATDVDVGDAWGHIAVRTDDLYGAYEGLMEGGVPDYRDPDSCGGRYAFVKDPDGHQIEIVTRDFGVEWSLDHTMMRVEDADAALGFWTRKFEYEHVGRWEADSFANYFLRPPEASQEAMAVELTYNYDGRAYTMGNGWGHLGVAVDDLGETWERLMLREATAIAPPADGAGGVVCDRDGHEIQIVE